MGRCRARGPRQGTDSACVAYTCWYENIAYQQASNACPGTGTRRRSGSAHRAQHSSTSVDIGIGGYRKRYHSSHEPKHRWPFTPREQHNSTSVGKSPSAATARGTADHAPAEGSSSRPAAISPGHSAAAFGFAQRVDVGFSAPGPAPRPSSSDVREAELRLARCVISLTEALEAPRSSAYVRQLLALSESVAEQ